MRKVLAGLMILLLSGSALAAPVISGHSANWGDGQTVTITGTGFLDRDDIVWEVFDDGTAANPVAAGWTNCVPNSSSAQYNCAYRTPSEVLMGSTVVGLPLPHTNIQKYTSMAAWPNGGFFAGWDSMMWKTYTAPADPYNVYVQWLANIQGEQWNFSWNTVEAKNIKYFEYGQGNDTPYTGGEIYISYNPAWESKCNLDNDEALTFGGAGSAAIEDPDLNGENSYWGITNGFNPINPHCDSSCGASCLTDWINFEMEMKITEVGKVDPANTGFITTWEHGRKVMYYQGKTENFSNSLHRMSVGGYQKDLGEGNWRYYADINMAIGFDALARVSICTGSTRANRGRCYAQPIVSWSDTSISIKANQSVFANQTTAYLYVVDKNNVANASGTAITWGAVPTTYHVRTDGDDTLCTGKANAGVGSQPNCAFLTPARCTTIGMVAGDTCKIWPGTYVVGE